MAEKDAEKEPAAAPAAPLMSVSGRVEVESKGVRGWLANVYRNNFVARLTRVVGWRFVIITYIIYGLDEGGIGTAGRPGVRRRPIRAAGLTPSPPPGP